MKTDICAVRKAWPKKTKPSCRMKVCFEPNLYSEGKRKVSLCLVTPPQAAVVLNEISIVLNVRLTVLNYGPRW